MTKLRVCDKEECDKVVSVTKLCVCVCDQEECDKEECDKLVCVKDCVCERFVCACDKVVCDKEECDKFGCERFKLVCVKDYV